MLGIDAGPAQDTAPLMLEHTAATEPGVAQEQLLTLQADLPAGRDRQASPSASTTPTVAPEFEGQVQALLDSLESSSALAPHGLPESILGRMRVLHARLGNTEGPAAVVAALEAEAPAAEQAELGEENMESEAEQFTK